MSTVNRHLNELLGVGEGDQAPPKDPYEDLRAVLYTQAGLRTFARMLADLGVGMPSWRPNSSIYRDTALKDYGDSLLAEIAEADEQIFVKLQYAIRACRSKENV